MALRVAVLVCGMAVATAAQVYVQPGDVGVVTTAGFYFVQADPPQGLPSHHQAPAVFGLTDLPTPGIAWVPDSDAFLVCAADGLTRLTLGPVSTLVEDISPALPAGAVLTDIDIHPGSGRMAVLDTAHAMVAFFDPPFTPGMSPVATLAVPASARSVCIDSYRYPPSVIYAMGTEVQRSTLDGVTSTVAAFKKGDGVDNNPQSNGGTYITKQSSDDLLMAPSSASIVQDLNIIGFCTPVVLGPRSVAYEPISNLTYVLAAGGLNPNCYSGVFGVNHVVAFPPAIGPVLPRVLTPTFNTTIYGTDGDLAVVSGDFAFGSPYGPDCTAPDGSRPHLLNNATPPAPPNPGYSIKLSGATPLAPVFVWVGTAPDAIPLATGCTFLVDPYMSFLAGTTNANGKLVIGGSIPAGVPIGTEIFAQAAIPVGGQYACSNGLQIHMGID